MFYYLEPEIAGGFGKNSVIDDPKARPPLVRKLHYRFDGWLGDDLLETVACFIATKMLADALRRIQATGVRFDRVEVSKSEQFQELYPHRELPEFVWLKITGRPGVDDFGLSKKHRLVVSERALAVMKALNLNHCEMTPYDD